jgi:type VI secretion system protein ImpK
MSGDDKNKTVFRPSPLKGRGAGSGEPGPANPFGTPTPTPPAGGFSNTDDWNASTAQPRRESPPSPSGGSFQPLSQDPFARPGQPPAPAGQPLDTTHAQFQDSVPQPEHPREDRNPMMAHAAPVLAMTAALQSGRWQISMGEFYTRVRDEISKFEHAIHPLYAEGVRQRAKYAVCATVDDIAQNLPGVGGGGAQWAQRNMVVTFFRESIGGDRFWEFTQEMLLDPARNGDLIELFHACIATGFEGRTRAMPDGFSKRQQVSSNLIAALEHVRSLSQLDMVTQWRGENAPRKPSNFWEIVGAVAAAAAALCFVIFLVFFLALLASGQSPDQQVAGLFKQGPVELTRAAAPLAVPASNTEKNLSGFLEAEVDQGLVEVDGNRVRTTVGALFEPASAELSAGREAIFVKIGRAMEGEKGPIRVEGHADSDQIATIEFPNNFVLSKARAETVANIIRAQLTDKSRVTAEGKGDTVPLASNDTPEGKTRNRRVEVVIERGE